MRKFQENPELASLAGKKGSRAGVPNKANTDVRKAFHLLVQNNLEQLQADLDALRPIDRLRIILELSKFVIPTLQSVSLNDLKEAEMQGFGVITVRLRGSDSGNDAKVIQQSDEEGGDDGNDI